MNHKPAVSFIVPAYQAEAFICKNLKLLSDYCLHSKVSSEIIVVNDGSTDRTDSVIGEYLNESGSNCHVTYVNLQKNVGKGRAIQRGLAMAKGDYIVFTDCDLPYSFENMDNVVSKLIDGSANAVIANRMHKDSLFLIKSGNLSYIYIRHTAGRVYNVLVRLLSNLDLDDTQAGLKGFDRATAELIFRKMTIAGFSFDIDILVCAKEHGKKISTIPIDFNYEAEMSTLSFAQQVVKMTFDLSRVFLKRISGGYRG